MDKGRPGDLFGTPALGLLERPWPGGTCGELLSRMEQDASLAGNSYTVERDGRFNYSQARRRFADATIRPLWRIDG